MPKTTKPTHKSEAAPALRHRKRVVDPVQDFQLPICPPVNSDLLGTIGNVTLAEIARSARELFKADSVALCSYDADHQRFIAGDSIAVGITAREWASFVKVGLRDRGTVYNVLERGWIGVADVADEDKTEFISTSTRKFLKKIGARSFQGVALASGSQKMGILYVNYKRRVSFTDQHRQFAESFANYAALALNKNRLSERLKRAKNAASSITRAIASEDLHETLQLIAVGTQSTLDCDAVVLFTYDADARTLHHPPTMVGVRHVDLATSGKQVKSDSLVYAMLERDSVYLVEDAEFDPFFQNKRFAIGEGIKSCVAVPLIESKKKVGVMFINYRRPHYFVQEELEDINLFASQAAIAIRHAQLLHERSKALSEQQVLVDLSKALLASHSLQEILHQAVGNAARALKTPFSNIVLPNNAGDLIFAAAKGWIDIQVGTTKLPRGTGSQTGYIIETKRAIRVDDYRDSASVPFQVPLVVFQNNIISGMGVPMFDRDSTIVGALLVHSTRKRHFSDDEETLLQLIANQTAIAIKNAQQSESLARTADLIRVLTGDSPLLESSSLGRILGQAVTSLKTSYDANAVICGSIWIYDKNRDELMCQCVHSSQEFKGLACREGRKVSLGLLASENQRIGILGRTVRTQQLQIVEDVRLDPDYIEFDPRTVSEITVPLFNDGALIGTLNIESDCPIRLEKDGPDILGLIGHLTARAQVAELQGQKEVTTRQYKSLAQASLDFAAASDEEDAILAVMMALSDSGFKDILLSLYDPPSGEIKGHSALGRWEKIDLKKLTCRFDGKDVRAEALRTGSPILIEDSRVDPRFDRELIRKSGIRGQLVVPLALNDEAIGTLQIGVNGNYGPESDKRFILQTFSNHLSLAISRIRNLLKAVELTDQVVAGSRFIAAETLASLALHSLGHKLDNITTKITEDLKKQEVRQNRPLFGALKTWLADLSVVEKDFRKALEFVKSTDKAEDYDQYDLHAEVQRAIDMWFSLITASKASIHPRFEATNTDCRIAAHAFREILSVLIVNSAQAHAKKMEIRTYNATDLTFPVNDLIPIAFCLDFADNGEGLSTINPEEIFDATYSTKPQKFGTGLGLFIARRLAAKAGGYLQVAGDGPGKKGVTFRLILPCRTKAK